jgi:hypothetical protein
MAHLSACNSQGLCIRVANARCCAYRHRSLQASLNDGLFGVGAPSIADISLMSMQPSVTFEDSPGALSK